MPNGGVAITWAIARGRTLRRGARVDRRIASLVAAAFVSICGTIFAILPSVETAALVIAAGWFIVPGIVATRRLYGGRWSLGALLIAPTWGYFFSSMALLALWFLGFRTAPALLLAPLAALPVAWLTGWVARGRVRLPVFDRHDTIAVCLVLLLVPLVVGRPYARVGETTPDGTAYRAYFTADFVWAMAVVSEVSKGERIPRNPYLRGDELHYYWLAHLFPAIEHRALRKVPLEKLLLVDAVLGAVGFVAFLYFFTRHFTHRASAAAAGCVGVVLFTSFEGVHQLVSLWRMGAPLDLVRYLNIDAVTRWIYGSMPVDGLQRLLLYQPQHQMGYGLAFSALIVLVEGVELADAGTLVLAGVLLGGAFLVSTFAAVMLTFAGAAHHGIRIVKSRAWRAIGPSLLGVGLPIGAAIGLGLLLGYIDEGRSLVTFGTNPLAANNWPIALALSFGPVAAGAAAATAMAVRNTDAARFGMPLTVVGISLACYFWVDVIDHQDVYVGWRAGHLTFIACAPLCAYLVQELRRRGRAVRTAGYTIATLVCLLAAPTTIIDLYNTQDISNRHESPSGHWTLILSPDEVEALTWIRRATPYDALVQVEPTVRDPETWAFIPAFGERRMAAGLPISMVPLQPYQTASSRIRRVYRSQSLDDLYSDAVRQGIDYLVVGSPERAAYPRLEPLLDSDPWLFTLTFHNASVRIYHVNAQRQVSSRPITGPAGSA